jgi:hypothetical protein
MFHLIVTWGDDVVEKRASASASVSLRGNNGAGTAAAGAGKGGKGGRRHYSCQSSIASRDFFDGSDNDHSNDQGKM